MEYFFDLYLFGRKEIIILAFIRFAFSIGHMIG